MTGAVDDRGDAATTTDPAGSEDAGQASSEVIEELHATLAGVDGLPLGDRVDVFERINATIVAQLADLDQL